MNKISVELITKPNVDPIALIGGLARLTQIKKDFEFTSHERGAKILEFIDQAGHTSLLEHALFGVVIKGASRVFLAQITRHRMASYMSQSQQYQDHDNFPYVIPPSLLEEQNSDLLCHYSWLMNEINEFYLAAKPVIGKDDARYALPGSARNDLFITANARELIYAIFRQRLCKRNTAEPLYTVKLWLKCLVDAGYEELFRLAGPTCVTCGVCREGKMACGEPYNRWEELIDVSKDDVKRDEVSGSEAIGVGGA